MIAASEARLLVVVVGLVEGGDRARMVLEICVRANVSAPDKATNGGKGAVVGAGARRAQREERRVERMREKGRYEEEESSESASRWDRWSLLAFLESLALDEEGRAG